MKILIFGQGYVGLPLAMAAIKAGHEVVGIESDDSRVSLIRNGVTQVSDISASTIAAALETGRYRVVGNHEYSDCFDYAILATPTPLKEGKPQMDCVVEAGGEVARLLTKNSTVILESTTYPGTTDELLVPLLESGSGLKAGSDFWVGYSPERIDPGNDTWSLTNTPKITSGINKKSAEMVVSFYEGLGIPCVPVRGTREAEMVKLLENTFRHVNIALVNELSIFARHLGVNFREAVAAAETKPFGFMRFDSGPGVGGHCLPVDPSYLSWAINEKSGEKFEFVELANLINRRMPEYVVDRVRETLLGVGLQLRGANIGLFGLAYKANSADSRESPAIEVAKILISSGAQVYALDDHVPRQFWPEGLGSGQEIEKFDLGVVLTAHSGLSTSGFLEKSSFILDTRGVCDGPNVEQL